MSGLIGRTGSKSGIIGAKEGSRIKFGRTHYAGNSSGTVTKTGLGFKPSKLLCFMTTADGRGVTSIGFASNEGVGNDDGNVALGTIAFADDYYYTTTSVASGFGSASGNDTNHQNTNFTSFDADGFTLTRAVNGSPGDYPTHLTWIAFE
jgi:hypothetical protein